MNDTQISIDKKTPFKTPRYFKKNSFGPQLSCFSITKNTFDTHDKFQNLNFSKSIGKNVKKTDLHTQKKIKEREEKITETLIKRCELLMQLLSLPY